MKKRAGFTLLELLVVLAVTALVLAIVVPTIQNARIQAKKSACLMNARSIQTSLKSYMTDWNELIPYYTPASPTGYWAMLIRPYGNVERVRQCPEATTPNYAFSNAGSAHKPWANLGSDPLVGMGAYGVNGWLFSRHSGDTATMLSTAEAIPAPEPSLFWNWPIPSNREGTVPVVGDCVWTFSWPNVTDQAPATRLALETGPGNVRTDQMQRWCISRHGRAVNIVFFDGHGETVLLPNLWVLNWNSQWTPTPQIVP